MSLVHSTFSLKLPRHVILLKIGIYFVACEGGTVLFNHRDGS